MPQNLWRTRFQTTRDLAGFPRPSTAASDLIVDDSYHLEGRRRAPHAYYLFKCTLEGEGRFADASRVYPLPPGRAFLCRICDPATAYFYPTGATAPWRHVYLTFYGADAMVDGLHERFGYVYDLPRDGTLIRRLRGYERFSGSTVDVSPGEGAALVMDVLGTLADAAAEQTAGTPHAWLIRQARRLMSAHAGRSYNVADLAADLDVSREHLCRVFRRETGSTPLAAMTQQKIRRACELLRDTPQAVKEIARDLGFDAPSHFGRTFRRIVGTTPQQYRQHGAIGPA